MGFRLNCKIILYFINYYVRELHLNFIYKKLVINSLTQSSLFKYNNISKLVSKFSLKTRKLTIKTTKKILGTPF